MRQIPQFEQIK